MVLRGFHSPVGPRASLVISESFRAAHLSALPTDVPMVPLPSYYSVLGVSGLQDPCAGTWCHPAESGHG